VFSRVYKYGHTCRAQFIPSLPAFSLQDFMRNIT
jgi:hypothetical protein